MAVVLRFFEFRKNRFFRGGSPDVGRAKRPEMKSLTEEEGQEEEEHEEEEEEEE